MNGLPESLRADAERARDALRDRLLAAFAPARPWTGRLSGSAVATAVAAFALSRADARAHAEAVGKALDWLAVRQNADGGWGDSPESPSNLAATLLAWSAVGQSRAAPHASCERRCEGWLRATLGGLDPAHVARGVAARYGSDRTFAAPILTLCALAGRLGQGDSAWGVVPPLPFEMAVLPRALFRWLDLTVVSYGVPALIGMGLARHARCPSRHALARVLRRGLTPRLLRTALRMQPTHGGYEEAAPLTGFVAMALCEAGHRDHPVVRLAVEFLLDTVREDGSWPIDTDLALWVTCQAVCALGEGGSGLPLAEPQRQATVEWLLAAQFDRVHPLTGGAAGGWGWTDLPGAMPDADDTSGALLALRRLGVESPETARAARRGVRWLLDLQNRDGGMPTFARGWGKLPFDRSCPDITAHAVEALAAWLDRLPRGLRRRAARGMRRMVRHLGESQSPAGSWLPLWFGSQTAPGEGNPVYGTARAVVSLDAAARSGFSEAEDVRQRGSSFLRAAQNPDGGWGAQPGAPSGIEETGLALRAVSGSPCGADVARGVRWLVERTDCGRTVAAAPIGLYFARLWYSEELYPTVFALAGLSRALASR
jgi:squalene-hopene/tetraprenyl-beta-curcumene cyclase